MRRCQSHMRRERSQRTGDRPNESKKIYVGMDVHKDSVMMAVLPEGASEPTVVERLPNEERKLKRFLDRLGREAEVYACYEASGAG